MDTGRRGRPPKVTREQWADAAIAAIARGGLEAVAVEPLARELGVTKGSFYGYFKGREDLVAAALDRWEQLGTERVLRLTGGVPDPRTRIERLFTAAFDPESPGTLLTFLAANAEHPVVRPVLERVTRRRVDHLAAELVALGLGPEDAAHRALLCYTAYVGIFQVMASAPDRMPRGKAMRAYVQHLIATLLPPRDGCDTPTTR